MKSSSKPHVLINGHGQSRFYFGIDKVSGEYIVGLDHPQVDTVIFLSGPVLASINGWIARTKDQLTPVNLH